MNQHHKHVINHVFWVFLLICALALAACSTVPITGREQLTIIPENQIMALSFDQYQQFLSKHEVITGTPEAEMVKTVGGNIKTAVTTYMQNQTSSGLLDDYQWEFSLVKDDAANAFALPGGKVVVFNSHMDSADAYYKP